MGAKAKKRVKLSANSGKLENPIVVAHIVKSYSTNGEVVVKCIPNEYIKQATILEQRESYALRAEDIIKIL